jgi:hypothetical protein
VTQQNAETSRRAHPAEEPIKPVTSSCREVIQWEHPWRGGRRQETADGHRCFVGMSAARTANTIRQRQRAVKWFSWSAKPTANRSSTCRILFSYPLFSLTATQLLRVQTRPFALSLSARNPGDPTRWSDAIAAEKAATCAATWAATPLRLQLAAREFGDRQSSIAHHLAAHPNSTESLTGDNEVLLDLDHQDACGPPTRRTGGDQRTHIVRHHGWDSRRPVTQRTGRVWWLVCRGTHGLNAGESA